MSDDESLQDAPPFTASGRTGSCWSQVVLKLNTLRLNHRIFVTIGCVLFFLFATGSWLAYSLLEKMVTRHLEEDLQNMVGDIRGMVESAAQLSLASYLRALAEQDRQMLFDLEAERKAWRLTPREARERARRQLLSQRIGSQGYTYVIDSNANVLVHPEAGVEGTNVGEAAFVQEQVSRKTGFLEYDWRNPGEPAPRRKYLYMVYFQPWDWIVSVTAYRDELPDLLKPEDFVDQLLARDTGGHTRTFVVTDTGDILGHPDFSGNIYRDGNELSRIIKEFLERKEGRYTFSWQGPRDSGPRMRTAVFSTLDKFGWLIVTCGDEEDLYRPLHTLQKALFALLFLGILCSLAVSFYLSRSITAPLHRLLRRLSEQPEGAKISVPAGERDEIAELSEYFSQYIGQMRDANRQLASLLARQRKTAIDLSIFQQVFEHSAEGITITDASGSIIQVNPAFSRITGFSRNEAVGMNPRILKSERHPPEFYQQMWQSIRKNGYWAGEIWNRRKDGSFYPEWLTISAIRNPEGEISHYAAMFNDISTIVEQKERIEFLAYHDDLTGLPNRLYLLEDLKKSFAACRRHGGEIACLVIDLDNFKTVNDSLGHPQGDNLLKLFVERAQPVVRAEETFGRIAGDEFALIVRRPRGAGEPFISVIERLGGCVEEPFVLEGQRVHLTLSIGVAVYPADADNGDDLIKRADLALSQAQKQNGNSFSLFAEAMETEIKKKLHYLSRIRSGLENDEFEPFYQPKVDLATGRVIGMEALARWRSQGRLISPADFVPLAEQSGLIIALANRIYPLAFRETARLRAQGHELGLSVNLAPPQLHEERFLENLLAIQSASGLAPEAIELEVTESTLMRNVEESMEKLGYLAERGFRIAIDDFGTGYSSLQYLKLLPLHTMKIDMAFVSGIGRNPEDEALIRIIVEMAGQFGLAIVAEGIEEKHQEQFLVGLGCGIGQGYLYGKPMPVEEFREYLRQRAQPPESGGA